MTWTIYNNTTPFGLLDEEQSEAMLEHKEGGGKFRAWIWSIDEWTTRIWGSELAPNGVYQAIRAPVKETKTRKAWARSYNCIVPMLFDHRFDGSTPGTVTTTAVDGKPKRIVWEAD